MRYTFRHIIPCFLILLLVGCVSENDWPINSLRQGSFSLNMVISGLNAEVETRADGVVFRALTSDEAANYMVTLSHDGEPIWAQKVFSQITLPERTQSVGKGYMVSAMSCAEEDIETANKGWGQPLYVGKSDPFEVKSKETTQVQVNCRLQNAGFCVVFDKTFTDRFPTTYAVTTNDARDLTFNYSNEAVFTGKTFNKGQIAYYKVGTDGTVNVPLLITGADGWDRVRLERFITLEAGKIFRLIIRLGETDGQMGVIITYDDEFELVESEIVVEE